MARLHCAYVRVHAHITMGLNYAWPSLTSYHLSFWESTAAELKPPPMLLVLLQGGGHIRRGMSYGLAPNIQGMITLAKNILANIIISVLKVKVNVTSV